MLKNKILLSFAMILYFMPESSFSALTYSKVEYLGCPEDSYCQKITGEVRQKWLENLELFTKNKMTVKKINEFIQTNHGLPITGWAAEEASVLPRIIMWDSPCKQHKSEASKFYISDFFRKNLKDVELKEFSTLYFSRAVGLGGEKKIFSMPVPRDEIPTFIENDNYYFLREDEGKYYGLYLNRRGDLRLAKVIHINEVVKEAICPKELIDFFLKESPSSTFYESYLCRGIWDKTTKSYKTMLFGWSCH